MICVLHVTGAGRSGSTLLGRMLGQIPGFFDVGEAGYLWERGLAADGLCGCGRRVRRCPVWSAVLEKAFGGVRPDVLADMSRLHSMTTRGRNVLAAAVPGRSVAAPERYHHSLARLYGAVAEVSGCRIVVDTTKPAPYAHILARTPGIELTVVHLVRDPRAVAWSWLRHKADSMAVRPAWRSALLWRAGNRAAARLRGERYLLLRYEDLIGDPRRRLREIALLADPATPRPRIPAVDAGGIELRPTHTVAGNVDRHTSGRTPLRADDQWTGAMPAASRRVVELLTFPAGRHYGYRR
ncbi:sulfotransferase [Nonomuraea endophytica]|uniref:sulfotransferase n=1 Tax=Nonomuraea endophytica TaxID=714136 RepID=UPI0037CC16D4